MLSGVTPFPRSVDELIAFPGPVKYLMFWAISRSATAASAPAA
jgi:hypothetical protein